MRNQNETGEKIQRILTDRKTLSAVAAFILVYALLVALWRGEKKNKERQKELLEKIEKAQAQAEELGIEEEERRKLAQYVVEQDLADRLATFIEKISARLKFHNEESRQE